MTHKECFYFFLMNIKVRIPPFFKDCFFFSGWVGFNPPPAPPPPLVIPSLEQLKKFFFCVSNHYLVLEQHRGQRTAGRPRWSGAGPLCRGSRVHPAPISKQNYFLSLSFHQTTSKSELNIPVLSIEIYMHLQNYSDFSGSFHEWLFFLNFFILISLIIF